MHCLREVEKSLIRFVPNAGICQRYLNICCRRSYIAAVGNTDLILHERGGIRSFDNNSTRDLLNISGIALIQKETSLPIIVDLSHSPGRKDILLTVAKAVLVMVLTESYWKSLPIRRMR